MPPVIDYSKWDEIDCSSSEDESSAGNHVDLPHAAKVTTLDSPSRVTLTNDGQVIVQDTVLVEDQNDNKHDVLATQQSEQNGTDIVAQASPNVEVARAEAVMSEALRTEIEVEAEVIPEALTAEVETQAVPIAKVHAAINPTAVLKQHQQKKEEKIKLIDTWTKHGGVLNVANYSDADENNELYWCQDRETITLRLTIPRHIKGKDLTIKVFNQLSFANRHSATIKKTPTLEEKSGVGEEEASIKIIHNPSTILLQGNFPYPIHANEDDEDGGIHNYVTIDDWTIEPYTIAKGDCDKTRKRIIQVTFNKATPMAGMVLWWKRPLTIFPEIELKSIVQMSSSSSSSSSFQQTWDKAHEMFKEKMKAKKK